MLFGVISNAVLMHLSRFFGQLSQSLYTWIDYALIEFVADEILVLYRLRSLMSCSVRYLDSCI